MIATSLVLVAMVAFVLQGAALAKGHSHGAEPWQTNSDAHAHSHDEIAPHSHDHVADGNAPAASASSVSHDHASSSTDTCCGKFCSAVICVTSPDLVSVKYDRQSALRVHSQVTEGIGPSGLKRPPRTIGMT